MTGYDVPDHVLSKLVVSQRGKWWTRQSLEAQKECWERAKHHRSARAGDLKQQHDILSQQLDELLEQSKADGDSKHPAMCMSIAAVSDDDLAKLQRSLECRAFCEPKRVQMLRCNLLSAPVPTPLPPLPEGVQIWSPPHPQHPHWAKVIAAHRDFFQDCAIVFQADGVTQYHKIVYCVQRPNVYVATCKMEPTDRHTARRPQPSATMQDVSTAHFDHAFRCNFGILASAADLPALELDQISVLFSLKHVGGVLIVARGTALPLRGFLHGEATPRECLPSADKEPVYDKELESLVLEMPWLEHLTVADSFVVSAKKAADKASASDSLAAVVQEFEIDEEEVFAALDTVERARATEAGIDAERGNADFQCKENYGESNLRKGKEFHDAVQGQCSNKGSDEWARMRGLQVTFKATFGEHTEDASRVMVRAWVHRMQFFYSYEQAHGGEGFEFTQDITNSYLEPDEFTRLARECTKATTKTRIAKIRKLPFK